MTTSPKDALELADQIVHTTASGTTEYILSVALLSAHEKLEKARVALRFYGTYSPRQHPEGFYEIHVAPGEGGEVRFGTRAREALKEIEG